LMSPKVPMFESMTRTCDPHLLIGQQV